MLIHVPFLSVDKGQLFVGTTITRTCTVYFNLQKLRTGMKEEINDYIIIHI